MQALVQTTITQLIEVPEGCTKQDLLNFLADWQSFNEAFQGVSDPEQKFRIINIVPESDDILELGELEVD